MMILSLKWVLAIYHQKNHNTKRSNVSFRGINLALKDLWGHKVRTSDARFELRVFYGFFDLMILEKLFILLLKSRNLLTLQFHYQTGYSLALNRDGLHLILVILYIQLIATL